MALPILPTYPIPEAESGSESSIRMLSANLGDGYRSDAPDGINALSENWTLNYNKVTRDERNIIVNFLVGRNGRPFYWDWEGGTKYLRYTCTSWRDTRHVGRNHTLSLTLVQDFGHSEE